MEGVREADDLLNSLVAWMSVIFWAGFALVMFRPAGGWDVPDWVIPVGGVLAAIELGGHYSQWKRRRGSDGCKSLAAD